MSRFEGFAEAMAEIDRLRAENTELGRAIVRRQEENDHLREENAELKKSRASEFITYGPELESVSKTMERLQDRLSEYMEAEHRLRIENDRMRAERDEQREENAKLRKSIEDNLERLRAENAELRGALTRFSLMAEEDEQRGDDLLWTTNWFDAITEARAILAKTAKADSAAQSED